ncbi:alpha-glucosidase [Anaerotalea alkaliphila]|uniref:Alpha-glucosidase n=1 Tax=Anaerotalea alkaliphila TaxID=2662126 RepID=A0A7X5HTQ5_9FIRM|nr:alpha-glucosidase [Anaerotalea alkaliphila]NDL66474.1 alpha-glucosidase [Anaerotalea alkaliphila]
METTMEAAWWKEAVVYQIYPKSFCDSNGDGIGDLGGVTRKLGYLKELGVDAVWLCPFYRSPMRDNGYDISDYYGVDPTFGTMEDMEGLLAEAKKHGIVVVIDMVLNHTSDEHPWFKAALGDPGSPYRDYYIFKEGEAPPSNARSLFGGSVWEQAGEGECYFHAFDRTQPDLNWENPQLRQEIYDMMNFWLDKGVGGFRMDAITFIKKDLRFPTLAADQADGMAEVAKSSLNQPGIIEFLREMKDNTYGPRNAMTVAEAPGVPYGDLGAYIGEEGCFSMLFDFSYTDIDLVPHAPWYEEAPWTWGEFKRALFRSQESIQAVGWGAVYLENHDQPRSINKYFERDGLEEKHLYHMGSALATLYFLLRGTPFIHQGQEIGMRNCPFESIGDYDDVNTRDQYKRALEAGHTREEALKVAHRRSRDNSRTPMQWDGSDHGGFSTHTPWLKQHPDWRNQHVAKQLQEEGSLLSYYRKLIALRKSDRWKPVLVHGGIREVPLEQERIVAYIRHAAGRSVLVVANMGKESGEIRIPWTRRILGNYKDLEGEKGGALHIRPYEALVLEITS